MSWFGGSRKGAWDLASVERPWGDAPSIYDHVRAHVRPGMKGLAEGGEELPDEKDDGKPKWIAGGLDGAFGHHGASGSEKDRARLVHRALGVVLEDATPVKLGKLYDLILDASALDFIDPLLERMVEAQDLDVERLGELTLWLAMHAPDREPVKFAIALLGVIPGADHSELFLTLGRHEEFTLYAAVALSNRDQADVERNLFELAQHVEGWGRIQVVERLAKTSDPAIKAWMLREGYRNSVMIEYLAYTCAWGGGLRAELEQDAVDPALMTGAGDLIVALIAGGPAENMDDYEDGAAVVERYLHHLGARPVELAQLFAVGAIERFLDEDADWADREGRGWTAALRVALRTRVVELKELPHWNQLVLEGLASTDEMTFHEAAQAARVLGIDTWEQHFARLEGGDRGGWYAVMQTDDPARIDRVVALAEETIPLDAIATGPAQETGLGPAWTDHQALQFVLQDLRRFPGVGWPLLRAGIRSPVIRNRHMALRALSPWGADRWPPEARALLERTRDEEPDESVRASIETLLAGKAIEDPPPEDPSDED